MSGKKTKKQLYDAYSKIINPDILDDQIDSLYEDYLKKIKLYHENDVDDLPSKEDIKWWFQDRPESTYILKNDGTRENVYEICIDDIFKNDPLAELVFKTYYHWHLKCDATEFEYPELVNNLIDLKNKYASARRYKKDLKRRLTNIALIGNIRMYGLLGSPYLCPTEIESCFIYFIGALDTLDALRSGELTINDIDDDLYIFDSFGVTRYDD